MRFPFIVYFSNILMPMRKILIAMRIIPQRYENIFSLGENNPLSE